VRPGGRLLRVAALTAVVTAAVLALAPTAGDRGSDHVVTVDEVTVDEDNAAFASPSPSPSVTTSPSPTPSPSGSASTSPAPSLRTPSPPAGQATLAGATVGGWYAGASGVGVSSGEFASWLGQPVTVASTWSDQSDDTQRTLPSLDDYATWPGVLDIAIGGTVLGTGENYAAAASGAYDARWRSAAATLAAKRAAAKHPTFARPFHEMNGDWYDNWMVTRANSADYKKAWARYVGILRAAMPTVYIAWSPNYTDHTRLPVDHWYPGDALVDCVAPDYYDDGSGPERLSVDGWNVQATALDSLGNPAGPEAWRRFALRHGKPLCFPEWGLKPEGAGVDHPEWIRAVNAWMNAHANTAAWQLGRPIPRAAAGTVLYSSYFNVVHQGDSRFTIYGTGANPQAAKLYPTMRWGNRRP
jgi:hypothetical protein